MVTKFLPLELCESPVSNTEVRKAGQNWSSSWWKQCGIIEPNCGTSAKEAEFVHWVPCT